MPSDKDIDLWLERVADDAVNLSPWEEEFIESVLRQWRTRRTLTEKQQETLERIYTDRVP